MVDSSAQSRSQAYLLRLQCHVGARPGLVGVARRRVVDSPSESTWILNRDLTVRLLNSDLTVVGLVEAVLIENIKWIYTQTSVLSCAERTLCSSDASQ